MKNSTARRGKRQSSSKSKKEKPSREPLSPPIVDPDFEDLPWLERVSEVLWYTVLCIEYALSPTRKLRNWIKLVVSIFLWVGIPSALLLPGLKYLSKTLADIAQNAQTISIYTTSSLVVFSFLLIVLVVVVSIIRR